jgi:glycosyltransferase involved in cell wall biosynthesis
MPVLALPPASVRLDRTTVIPMPVGPPVTLLALCGNEAAGGAATLVEALASLPAEHRPAVVLAGPAVEEPGAVPRDRLAASGVSFTSDTLTDTATALARSHAVLDLSPRVGNPVGLARALACGRPIVASDVPGNRELVDAKVSGLLFDPADAVSLAIAMRSITNRAELFPAMARAARAKAERLLDSRDVDGRIIAELGLA